MEPVIHGSLGILDLSDMNKGLTVKWIYNYVNNTNVLWRKVVCVRSKSDPNRLLAFLGNCDSKSLLLGFVKRSLERNDRVRDLVNQHLRALIGNGQNTDFWNDDWMGRRQLCTIFLRIFALACSKSSLVKNFGSWCEGRSRWDIQLRKRVFDWEVKVWEDFLNIIEGTFFLRISVTRSFGLIRSLVVTLIGLLGD